MKYVIGTVLVVLAILCKFLFDQNSNLKDRNKELLLKNDNLITSIKEFNNAQVVAGNTITKIQEKVKYIKSDCNCYNLPIDDSIVKWVRGTEK